MKNKSGWNRCLLAAGAFYSFSGASGHSINNLFPVIQYYPDVVPIVYPGFTVAAGANPAALPSAASGTAVQGAFSPAASGGPMEFSAAIANSSGKVGFGIGYLGASSSGQLTNSVFGGLGTTFGKVNMGLALRQADLSRGTPSVDAGLLFNLKVVDLAFSLYNVGSFPTLAVGVGSRSQGQYNLEANVLVPTWTLLSLNYLLTVAAQIQVKAVSVYFRTSYQIGAQSLSFTLGLGVWAGKRVHLLGQFISPQRLVGAMTITF